MKRNIILALTAAALTIVPVAFGQDTGTSNLGVTVGPEASFAAALSGTTMTASNAKFGGFTGSTSFTFKVRTTETGGTGAITLQLTNFETGGPAMADLSYTCTNGGVGTACASSTTASSSAATNVITFGAAAHSTDAGDTGSVAWALVDKTDVKTGTYSSVATFTISAA